MIGAEDREPQLPPLVRNVEPPPLLPYAPGTCVSVGSDAVACRTKGKRRSRWSASDDSGVGSASGGARDPVLITPPALCNVALLDSPSSTSDGTPLYLGSHEAATQPLSASVEASSSLVRGLIMGGWQAATSGKSLAADDVIGSAGCDVGDEVWQLLKSAGEAHTREVQLLRDQNTMLQHRLRDAATAASAPAAVVHGGGDAAAGSGSVPVPVVVAKSGDTGDTGDNFMSPVPRASALSIASSSSSSLRYETDASGFVLDDAPEGTAAQASGNVPPPLKDAPSYYTEDEVPELPSEMQKFNRRSSLKSPKSTAREIHDGFCLLDVWTKSSRSLSPAATNRTIGVRRDRSRYFEETTERVGNMIKDKDGTCVSALIMPPFAGRRLAWDWIGLVLILYDIVWTPLGLFDFPANIFTDVLQFFACIYWTLDLPSRFFVGRSTKEGFCEMRFTRIAVYYMQTWFFFDALLMIMDWLVTLGSDAFEEVGVVRIIKSSRLGKSVRVVRAMRLMRVFRAEGILEGVFDAVNCESVVSLFKVIGYVAFILIVAHYIACGWYALTLLGFEDEFTWSGYYLKGRMSLGEGVSRGDLYSSALHWSLTQFTPASMEIFPRNIYERSFNIFVVLFALISFTSLLSSITSTMTQLRHINTEKMRQNMKVREYLSCNNITVDVTTTVWNCLRTKTRQKKRVSMKDVVLFNVLPKNVLGLIQEQVFGPILLVHPLFASYRVQNPLAMGKIFKTAVSEVQIGGGEELFSRGDVADTMYFVVAGTLLFRTAVTSRTVQLGQLGQSGSRKNSAASAVASGARDRVSTMLAPWMPHFKEESGSYRRPASRSQTDPVERETAVSGASPFFGDIVPGTSMQSSGNEGTPRSTAEGDKEGATGSDEQDKKRQFEVEANQWCSESSLWLKHVHPCTLMTLSLTQALAVNAAAFREIATTLTAEDTMLWRYAAIFQVAATLSFQERTCVHLDQPLQILMAWFAAHEEISKDKEDVFTSAPNLKDLLATLTELRDAELKKNGCASTGGRLTRACTTSWSTTIGRQSSIGKTLFDMEAGSESSNGGRCTRFLDSLRSCWQTGIQSRCKRRNPSRVTGFGLQ
eukprot:TRINITY_DN11938_c0_g1_i2.p1 TRINITY_DN11938_c0_g1~~TRINITY_DN11938_c0_g1_i2.p1  ORF type:complete len:1094 (-),score=211.84 TRINITY_DN11938_c0_g1_i2:166-3447(-)